MFPNSSNQVNSFEVDLARLSAQRLWRLVQAYSLNPTDDVFGDIYIETQSVQSRLDDLIAENARLRREMPII